MLEALAKAHTDMMTVCVHVYAALFRSSFWLVAAAVAFANKKH